LYKIDLLENKILF